MYRYPPGRNVLEGPMPGVAGGMVSAPHDVGSMLPRDATIAQPMPTTALASALANATPEQQRTVSSLHNASFEFSSWPCIICVTC